MSFSYTITSLDCHCYRRELDTRSIVLVCCHHVSHHQVCERFGNDPYGDDDDHGHGHGYGDDGSGGDDGLCSSFDQMLTMQKILHLFDVCLASAAISTIKDNHFESRDNIFTWPTSP